jgi:hypothetical protein
MIISILPPVFGDIYKTINGKKKQLQPRSIQAVPGNISPMLKRAICQTFLFVAVCLSSPLLTITPFPGKRNTGIDAVRRLFLSGRLNFRLYP